MVFLVGLIVLIVYLTEGTDEATQGNSTLKLDPSEHTPQQTAQETWWISVVIIVGVVFLFSMPVAYYGPGYVWRPERRTQPAIKAISVPVRPLLALTEIGDGGEKV